MQILKILVLSILIFIASTQKTTSYYFAPEDEITPQQELSIHEMIDYYADEFGVERALAHFIAEKESTYNPEAIGDIYITCNTKTSPYYGQPVYARGIYQITRCYHYNVSDEQAFDPEFNIEYAMKLIAKGTETCKQQFTTCRDYYMLYN